MDEAGAFGDGAGPIPRRVLDRLPSAVVLVDVHGRILYGNEALERLSGWSQDDVVGANIFDYIHPDDAEMLLDAFLQLVSTEPSLGAISPLDVAGDEIPPEQPWSPINFRFVTRSGEVVPVEVTGNGALDVAGVEAIIYEVRPAHERDVLQRVLAGVAIGGGLVAQFELVLELISASLFEIDSGILFVRPDGHVDVACASTPELGDALERAAESGELVCFSEPTRLPRYVDVATIEGRLGRKLAALGYLDAWQIDVTSMLDGVISRIIGFTRLHHVPSVGVQERLMRAAELASVIVLRVRSESLLERAAHHDPLTDLPNRLGLQREVADRRATGGDLVVLYVDLDDFKAVNDEHGHDIGDRVLSAVSRRLVASTAADDLVARLGGDEFVVILSSGVAPSLSIGIAQRLIDAIEAPILVEDRSYRISASVGVAPFGPDDELGAAIAAADRAMYVAKRAGGGQAHSAAADGDDDPRDSGPPVAR